MKLNEIMIPEISRCSQRAAINRINGQARPRNSLGLLEKLAIKLAGIYDSDAPPLPRIKCIVMCGDHGVAEELVSVFPQEVTINISKAFLKGGTALNVFSEHIGADFEIVDCGIKGDMPKSDLLINKKIRYGTYNISKKSAMSLEEAHKSMEIGFERAIEAYSMGYRVLAIGEIGNANTTVSSALMSALTGIPPCETVGRGTGVPDWQILHKMNVVMESLAINSPKLHDPVDCLRTVGGFEIGAMAGAIIGAASRRICVVVDGFISTVSALLAVRIKPAIRRFIVFGHISPEMGHRRLLEILNAQPLLDFELCLGEATGAILAASYIQLGCAILSKMQSFEHLKTPDPYR